MMALPSTSRLVAVETRQPLVVLSAARYAALDHTLRQLGDLSSNEIFSGEDLVWRCDFSQ